MFLSEYKLFYNSANYNFPLSPRRNYKENLALFSQGLSV